jgi:serine/threonine-protein kinase
VGTLAPGTRLGAYDVLTLIGSGGMGEVYRAHDATLDRDVAIKVLPAAFSADADRLARFRREAQVLAALNHPHIAHIYGLDSADAQQFLVMELVDGESLDKRLARGPIPSDDALRIGAEIAEALEAAQEKGIVHRDLKPANVALTRDGHVKVLDFGLAKAADAAADSAATLTHSPTIVSPAMMTGVGMLLGTAAYMSPEQAKGQPAGKRSDVWAFGCVLYEMLTGARAFDGDDVSETLASVLRGEPDWTRVPHDVPPFAIALMRQCVAKPAASRPPDMAAVRFVLANGASFARTIASPPSGVAPAGAPRRLGAVGMSVIATAALAGVLWWRSKPPRASADVIPFTIPLSEDQAFNSYAFRRIAIAPDGKRFVYTANNALYVRALSDLEARPIAGSERIPAEGLDKEPVFSPDGQSVAYFAGPDAGREALNKIAIAGGAPVTLCQVDHPSGLSWSDDGILYAASGEGGGIFRVPSDGGQPQRLIAIDKDGAAYGPHLLPDHDTVLFTLARASGANRWDRAQIVVQSLKSGRRTTLVDGGSDGRYLPTGHVVYAREGIVYAVPFDLSHLRVVGTPARVVEGVSRASNPTAEAGTMAAADFDVADTGSLVFIPGPASTARSQLVLARVDRAGRVEPLKSLGAAPYEAPRVSPDGQRIAVGLVDDRQADIWVADLSSGTAARRLTFAGRNRFPVWSPDGKRIAFQSDRNGAPAIFAQAADGTGGVEQLTRAEAGGSPTPESWSPDGRTLLFSDTSPFSLWALDLPSKSTRRLNTGPGARSAAFSPDGRWIAYALGVTIYVEPFPETGAKYQVWEAGIHPAWSPDGKELFSPDRRGLRVMAMAMRPTVTFTSEPDLPRPFTEGGPAAVRPYDMMRDGQHYIAVTNLQDVRSDPQFRVVLNWLDELKTRLPAE